MQRGAQRLALSGQHCFVDSKRVRHASPLAGAPEHGPDRDLLLHLDWRHASGHRSVLAGPLFHAPAAPRPFCNYTDSTKQRSFSTSPAILLCGERKIQRQRHLDPLSSVSRVRGLPQEQRQSTWPLTRLQRRHRKISLPLCASNVSGPSCHRPLTQRLVK